MLRNLFIILVLTGCSSTYKVFKAEQENYPVFSVGFWHSWNAFIFEDSVVYQRGWTDNGGILSKRFAAFEWSYLNDTTIQLNPLTKYYKRNYPDGLTFHLNSETSKCQLLIPTDSLERYNNELKETFTNEIVNWKFKPDSDEQEMIEIDSLQFYPLFEKENFSSAVGELSESFRKLGIWNGKGFKIANKR